MDDIAYVPLFVFLLLEKLDPHVGDGHGQSIIERDTTDGRGDTQEGHPGDIFGDGDDVRI